MACGLTGFALGLLPAEQLSASEAVLEIKAEKVVRELDRHRLLGTNIGLWYEGRQLFDADIRFYLRELHASYLRIPGGSWSDEYYWNGNGAWDGNKFDFSKLKDGHWQIDYSKYAPGFRVEGPERKPVADDFHGNVDVLDLHEFAKDKGSHSIVTVNFGSGTPAMAAEWVRWANLKKGYGVRYWEVGNELEGRWEMGHTLPDGSELTGEMYAKRFVEYAKAMKAVDPSIKVGGPAAANERGGFMPDLLRLAGDEVDFVSFHTYPVEKHLDSEKEIFDQAFSVVQAMERVRGWIRKYQPERKDEIEIGITEWNSKVVEDRDSADLLNGLWSTVFVGEMFRAGVSFATQWDLLTMTEEGGHGMFCFNKRCFPKSQYWGLWLWSKHMGNSLLAAKLKGDENLYSCVTKSENGFQVMLVNIGRAAAEKVRIEIPGVELGNEGRITTLSQREYSWDYIKHEPLWSHEPQPKKFAINSPLAVSVPPYCVQVYEIPFKGVVLKDKQEDKSAGSKLRLLLPESAPADLPIEGWVLAGRGGVDAPPVPSPVKLLVSGPATSDRDQVRISEAAGRFFLQPRNPGKVIIRAVAGKFSAEKAITITPVHERPQVCWLFENAIDKWGASSTYKLIADDKARPNQQVAAVQLENSLAAAGQDTLLALTQIPSSLPRKRIGGVVFDMMVSPDFKSADNKISVNVILQSESAHWVPLGAVALMPQKGKWQTFTIKLPAAKYYQVVGRTYALRFQLYQHSSSRAPATGTVYFDNVGFLLR